MAETDLVRNDFAQSAAALRSQPLLLVITFGLCLAPLLLLVLAASGPPVALLLGFVALVPILVFQAGFLGTQRIWFLRAYRDKSLRNDEIWSLSRAFAGRMIVLGLVSSLFFAVVIFLSILSAFRRGGATATLPWSYFLTLALAVFAVDAALTFVVPALSYTTRSVREAFRRGLRMIGETWPGSAVYVLTPGLLGMVLALVAPWTPIGLGGLAVLTIVGVLFSLWFKGAIAACYLRLHTETPDDGAAHLP